MNEFVANDGSALVTPEIIESNWNKDDGIPDTEGDRTRDAIRDEDFGFWSKGTAQVPELIIRRERDGSLPVAADAQKSDSQPEHACGYTGREYQDCEHRPGYDETGGG
jgi:hypothetical protein